MLMFIGCHALFPLKVFNFVFVLRSGIAVRMLREELQLLQEPGSYVGEVAKVMGKSKVLVKVKWLICIYNHALGR